MKDELLRTFIGEIWNEGNIHLIPEFIADKYTVFHDPGDPWMEKKTGYIYTMLPSRYKSP